MADFSARITNVRAKDSSNVVPLFRDGLINVISGMGTTTDARSYNRYFSRYMSDAEIDQAYRGSWVMRKAIDKPAREMVREWRDWQADSADIEMIEAEEKRLQLRSKVEKAERLAGLGGAGMVLYVPGDQMAPLDPRQIRAGGLRTIHVWHRSRFNLGEPIVDWEDPWFGYPSYFEVQLQGAVGSTQMRFHPSRVVAFRGDPVADIAQADWQTAFWGQSRVQTIIDAVQNVDTADNGFAGLIKDARNRRIYIPRLLELISTADGEAKLTKRLQAFALGESSNAVSWLDGGDGEGKGAEKIEDRQMSWTGMPDIMSAYRMAAAAAADMPATVMWGQSPQGMNATGESDIALWHKTIRGKQDLDLRPCMTLIDAALIPSALGRVDDGIWYEWAPLAMQSEKDEATTFQTTMDAVTKLQATGAIPDIAFSKGLQNLMSERGWMPGLDDALSELPEDERFPEGDPEGDDPSALQAGPRPLQVNDARFLDATPRTLYVQRKLINADELIRWAKAQGFETTLPAEDMHVTIAYSRTPLDWMNVGTDWSGDERGNLLVRAGGPRVVERMGDGGAVALQFLDDALSYRHQRILDAGASWDWPSYQPHVTISWNVPADFDLSKVVPYSGPLRFGPEIFEEVKENWKETIVEDAEGEQRRPFGDAYDPDQPRDKRGRWTSVLSFIEAVLGEPAVKKGQHRLGQIPDHVHQKFARLGISRRPKSVALDHDYVVHINKRHGSDSRGQRSVGPADIAKARRILVAGNISRGTPSTHNGSPMVHVKASLDGSSYEAAYELRKYRAILVSLRKR